MKPVHIAEALLVSEGACVLVELCCSGHKGDAAQVRCAMLKMFPGASHDELEAGLQLAVSIAQLDQAEAEAARH
ncbi:hypothetical protein [Phenylobacterium deserti]|uniref:Uncharacterized protein n=1 Tax=Phenylobacterium deserti TaxID=1914756 RepID=A0A328AAC2_9CAUL|nr:hypothetical protein [Phenylobacterium deserti]RAK51367.1 hypothetical protein DJ018_15615 [Phenylobacterium deserti]